MRTVVMQHPDLEGRTITVDALSVKHYQRSGWKLATDKTTAAPAARRRASEETK